MYNEPEDQHPAHSPDARQAQQQGTGAGGRIPEENDGKCGSGLAVYSGWQYVLRGE